MLVSDSPEFSKDFISARKECLKRSMVTSDGMCSVLLCVGLAFGEIGYLFTNGACLRVGIERFQ